MAALSFDNLGGNTLFGMVESFLATHFCRLCTANKSQTRKLTVEDGNILRSSASLQYDESSLPFMGIKSFTILNELQYFNVFDCSSVDIAHDILEGVGQLEIRLFLTFIVQWKLLSMKTLNQRINSFSYGRIDMADKPSPIVLEKPGALTPSLVDDMRVKWTFLVAKTIAKKKNLTRGTHLDSGRIAI